MQTRSSTIVLKYNDKNATEVITQDMSGFSWTDVASGEADTISLTLSNKNIKWLKGFFPEDGDFVKMWIKVKHWRYQKDNRTKFCGKFQIDDFGATGFANTCSLNGISIPIRTGFNKTPRNKTYKKTSVKQIMKDIVDRADIKLVYDADNYSIKEMSQSTTDMSFAFSLCKEYGLGMKVYNDKLVIYDLTRYEKKKPSYTIDISDLGGDSSYDYKRSFSNIYDGVKLQYSNKDEKNITYKYMIPGKKKGDRILFISGSADSHADAERKAKAQLLENLRKVDILTLKVMGDPKYKSCQVFKLTGFGKINGEYFIDKVTHDKSSGYHTTILCHRTVTQIG